jgi:thymidylate kinase
MEVIAIEGIDGAGKTTFANALKEKLENEIPCTVKSLHFSSFISDEAVSASIILKNTQEHPTVNALLDAASMGLYFYDVIHSPQTDVDYFFVDRYKSSFKIRHLLNGCDELIVNNILEAIPDIENIIYINTKPLVAYERIVKGRGANFKDNELSPQKTDTLRNRFISQQERAHKIYQKEFSHESPNILVIDGSLTAEEFVNAAYKWLLSK